MQSTAHGEKNDDKNELGRITASNGKNGFARLVSWLGDSTAPLVALAAIFGLIWGAIVFVEQRAESAAEAQSKLIISRLELSERNIQASLNLLASKEDVAAVKADVAKLREDIGYIRGQMDERSK
ncbi:MAG: hypothetical protein WAZ48_14285 [Lysobacteraceae bacterium]